MASDTATNPDQANAAEGQSNGAAKAPRKINGVYVSTPQVLREKLEADATAQNTSVAGMVRQWLAERYGLTLPKTESPIRKKYASDDERKLAAVKARRSRQEVIKALLEAHKARAAGDAAKADELEARATGIQTGQIEVEVPAPKAAEAGEGAASGEAQAPVENPAA